MGKNFWTFITNPVLFVSSNGWILKKIFLSVCITYGSSITYRRLYNLSYFKSKKQILQEELRKVYFWKWSADLLKLAKTSENRLSKRYVILEWSPHPLIFFQFLKGFKGIDLGNVCCSYMAFLPVLMNRRTFVCLQNHTLILSY